ncbi:hypothetical protein D1007_11823 [Hordeum vulgare]|nr:hypothetical protein D1007_11823 [Hordeum vulgare]
MSISRFYSSLHSPHGHIHPPKTSRQSSRNNSHPSTQETSLVEVYISEVSLHNVIHSRCPAVPYLLLVCHKELCYLRINSPNLISTAIHCDRGNLNIEDAHSLQRLLHDSIDTRLEITIVSAPKLDTLAKNSDLSDESKVVFGSTVIQGARGFVSEPMEATSSGRRRQN